MYSAKHKRPKKPQFDLIVIGSGAGGEVAAYLSAKAGKKVAIIEAEKMGGECPNFGCVPTKALLQAAERYDIAKNSAPFGVHATNVTFNYSAVRGWKDLAVRRTGTTQAAEIYKKEGVSVIKGSAHFLSPWTVSVDGQRYTAGKFVVATGTRSVVPPIPGLAEAGFLTYREALELSRPPKSLFIIGGGAIGCEFAQLFNTFGSHVQVADIAPRLIGVEDHEVGELLQAIFEAKGIDVHTSAKITRVVKEGSRKIVYFEKAGATHHTTVEEIFLSSGKAPNTDVGLENAGVAYDRTGIKVDRHLRTSARHIYAAGDVVGPYRFTHTAAYQSRLIAHNLWRDDKVAVDYRAVPRCVFVEPEIASVGLTEQQLKDQKVPYQVGAVPISIIGRSNTSNYDIGFVKVMATTHGILLGACVVSPRAGEVIHELTLAIQHRMRASAISETIHAFPTWSEAVRLACQKIKCK